uniref:Large ribosomal subunit protein mL40 n=1 Tax=Syphacia muris TaxID=451379 RepID=A0A0N5A8G0_9BILA
MNSLVGLTKFIIRSCQLRNTQHFKQLHTSFVVNSSVFVKKQKKIDPEIAKIREERKRRKLEKEIRQLKKHGKTPKPVEEMQLDIKSAKNEKERIRSPIEISEEEDDRRAISLKEYAKSRSALMENDDRWIRNSIRLQDKALAELKKLSPALYEAAIQEDTAITATIEIKGPTLTPPLPKFEPPDGDYIDVTRTWT